MKITFEYGNPYSSIDFRRPTFEDKWLNWTKPHREQGFCINKDCIGFVTYDDDEYTVTVSDEPSTADVINSSIFAVRVPFNLTERTIFVGGGYPDVRTIDLPGEYSSVLFVESPDKHIHIFFEQKPISFPEVLKVGRKFPNSTCLLADADFRNLT